LKAGVSEKSMNRELRTEGLFLRWPKPEDAEAVEEMFKSHAGYIEPISVIPVRAAKNILVIESAVYRGLGCSLDVTAVIYQRRPLRRLAYLNADPNRRLRSGSAPARGDRRNAWRIPPFFDCSPAMVRRTVARIRGESGPANPSSRAR
jgi:hypothetical protein